MPTIRQIREDINDTMTFFDVAEVLSAISSLAFVNISKLYETNFFEISKSVGMVYSFLNESLKLDETSESDSILSGPVKNATILIGSNLGFCGKFNNDIKLNYEKKIGSLHDYNHAVLIGGQLFGIDDSVEKIKFPVAKKIFWEPIIEHKTTVVDELINYFDEANQNFKINIFSNTYDYDTKKGSAMVRQFIYPATLDLSGIETIEDSGYYRTLNGVVLEPDPESFIKNTLKYHFRISLLSLLVQSEIVENFYRMNAMNQAKDEIEIILKQLKRKLQKMRQTKITNELLEVIAANI
ncbi:F0F1 ATP synthase subunit gamma [Bacteroidota bacterium]